MPGKRTRIKRIMQSKGGGNPHIYASCYGKIRHTREDALNRAKDIITMKAYKCKYCPHWHVGRKPAK